MNIAAHVTFDQLPTECKCLLSVVTMVASLQTGNRCRQSDEALSSLTRSFWDSAHLAPSDLSNLNSITDRLCAWIRSTRTTQN